MIDADRLLMELHAVLRNAGSISFVTGTYKDQLVRRIEERLSAPPEARQKPALLDLLTRIQQAAQPIDISHGDDDARIPAVLWREFVDAHAAMLYAKAHGGIDSETGVCNDHGILACEWCRPSSIPSPLRQKP